MKNSLSMIMAIVFLLAQLGIVSNAIDINEAESRKRELQQKSRELEKKASKAKEDVNKKQSEHNQNLSKLKSIEAQIDSQTREVEEIDAKRGELANTIAERKANIKEIKKILKRIIKEAYIKGEASELDLLFATKDVSDFFDTLILLQYVSDKVKDLIERANEEISKLEEENEALKAQEEQLRIARENLRKTQDEYIEFCKNSGQELNKAKAIQGSLADEDSKNDKAIEAENAKIRAYYENKANQERAQRSFNEAAPKVGGGWYWPVPSSRLITSYFGYRSDPFTGERRYHSGIDIGASTGSEIRAAESGVVELTGDSWSGGYGIYCSIGHGNGRSTLYAHMSRRYVRSGETVKKGQLIGLVGSTGRSTGPHLHFEYMINGSNQNPLALY